jgi:hypothetical protein
LKAFLSELLETDIQVLRLPELHSSKTTTDGSEAPKTINDAHFSLYGSGRQSAPDKKGKGRADTQDATADEAEEEETPLQRRQRQRAYALPKDGGPFKGFAFVVLRDQDKAEAAHARWNWDERGRAKTSVDGSPQAIDDYDLDEEVEPGGQEDETDHLAIGETRDALQGDAKEGIASEEAETLPDKKPAEDVEVPAAVRADRSGFRLMPM